MTTRVPRQRRRRKLEGSSARLWTLAHPLLLMVLLNTLNGITLGRSTTRPREWRRPSLSLARLPFPRSRKLMQKRSTFSTFCGAVRLKAFLWKTRFSSQLQAKLLKGMSKETPVTQQPAELPSEDSEEDDGELETCPRDEGDSSSGLGALGSWETVRVSKLPPQQHRSGSDSEDSDDVAEEVPEEPQASKRARDQGFEKLSFKFSTTTQPLGKRSLVSMPVGKEATSGLDSTEKLLRHAQSTGSHSSASTSQPQLVTFGRTNSKIEAQMESAAKKREAENPKARRRT
eukprot:RCo048090